MYLNVQLLSDICTAGGTHIDKGMYQGNLESAISTSKHHRVNQACPNAKAWKQWRRALKLLFCTPSRQLRTPLGGWFFTAKSLRRQWPVYYEPNENQVYCTTPEGYTQHSMLQYDYDSEPITTVLNLPATASPCDYTLRPNTISMNRYIDVTLPPDPPSPDTLETLIPTLEPWESHLFDTLDLLESEHDVWQALCNDTCLLVSDGSAHNSSGSFGWVLATQAGHRLVQCSGPAFGRKVTSFRAEGYGLLSATRFLLRMQEIYGTPDEILATHEVICDNQSFIQVNIKYTKYDKIFPNSTMASEWDIIAEIRQTHHDIPVNKPTFHHVKGHQDNDTPYEELPLRAQLNVDADQLAEDWLNTHPEFDHRKVPVLPTSGCQLNGLDGTITYNMKQATRQARTIPALGNKLMEKYDWDSQTIEDIAWNSHGRAIRRMDQHRVSLIKYLHRILPVGHLVHKYNIKYPQECPACNHHDETFDHFMECPARRQARQKWYQAVFQYTVKHPTAPSIQQLLLSAMKQVLEPSDNHNLLIDDSVAAIAACQQAIGWKQILFGRFSSSWEIYHNNYLGTGQTARRNGTTWLTGLIHVIFQQWWLYWEGRNQDRHGKDIQSQAEAKKRQAIREVTQLYDTYHGNIMPEHEWLLQIPLLQRIIQPTYALRQWITTWEPVLEMSYKTRLETG